MNKKVLFVPFSQTPPLLDSCTFSPPFTRVGVWVSLEFHTTTILIRLCRSFCYASFTFWVRESSTGEDTKKVASQSNGLILLLFFLSLMCSLPLLGRVRSFVYYIDSFVYTVCWR